MITYDRIVRVTRATFSSVKGLDRSGILNVTFEAIWERPIYNWRNGISIHLERCVFKRVCHALRLETFPTASFCFKLNFARCCRVENGNIENCRKAPSRISFWSATWNYLNSVTYYVKLQEILNYQVIT